MKKVINLKVNHLKNPLGYSFNGLNFSWEINEITLASSLLISTDESFNELLYTSGIQKNITNHSYQVDLTLEPRTRYFWKIRSYLDIDCTQFEDSVISWFETGKLEEKWNAQWITTENRKNQSIIFRKDFNLLCDIKKARLYIAGLGLYEAEINSYKVSDEYLNPGYHSYDGFIQYQTYDIKDLLHKGQNAMGVVLGNGWYKGRFGFDGGNENLYGDKLTLICELHIEYGSGETEIIFSDNTWTNHKSMILENNIYDGEVVYGTQYLDNISNIPAIFSCEKTKVIDKTDMSKLIERSNVPIKVKEIINPIELIKTKKGNWVLDFGQNFAGWVEFECQIEKGKKVVLQYSEHYQDDEFYNANLRTAKAEFVYHSMGIQQKLRPHFTYYGFRYVKVSGIENLNINDFKACVVYSDLEQTGTINTGNELLNKFIQNTFWSQKSNFVDIPTDCPQRDERMGWTGDAQIFSATAMYNMDAATFFTKYMIDLNYEQSLIDGAVPNIVPRLKFNKFDGFIDGFGASPWADAAVIIPWNLYLMYGDLNLLNNHYAGMKSWVDYESKVCKESGNEYLWTTGFHFADWLALDNYKNPYSPIGATESYYVASVFFYNSCLLVSKAAKALQRNEESDFYLFKAQKIKEAIVNEYFSLNGRITIDTQTARVLAIYFELLPIEHLLRLGNELVQMISDNGMHLDTGFVGTPLICKALTKVGQAKFAYNLLLNEDYPSWLYEVKMGATTVWERWNSIQADGKINETGMNSLNHYAYGSIVEWIYSDAAGIKPSEKKPGFEEFYLYPNIDGRLHYVDVDYQSSMGLINSKWEVLKTGELRINFTIPTGSKAYVRLPLPKMAQDDFEFVQDDQFIYFELTQNKFELLYFPKQDFLPRYSIETKTSELMNNDKTKLIIHQYLGEILKQENDIVNLMHDKPLSLLLSDYHFSRHISNNEISLLNNELKEIVV